MINTLLRQTMASKLGQAPPGFLSRGHNVQGTTSLPSRTSGGPQAPAGYQSGNSGTNQISVTQAEASGSPKAPTSPQALASKSDQAPPNSQLMRKDVTPYVPSGNELTENRLNGLLASDNPYIQAARARGEAQAARRGLLNSSMAGQAGEAAAINAATPIAAADAEKFHQAKMAGYQGNIQNWLAGQQYARTVDLANQQYQHQVGLIGVQEGASSRLSAQEANQNIGLANVNNAAMLQRTGLGIQGQEQIANINNAGALQRTGLQVQGQQQLANINNAATLNLESQKALWDKQLRTTLAGMQLGSEERRNLGAQAQSLGQEYLTQVSNVQRDPNVSADAKSGVLATLRQTYQDRLTDLGSIYGVNISW